jgi:hypothetical protein
MNMYVYEEWKLASSFNRFTPDTHRIGSCMGLRVGLDAVAKRKICVCAGNLTTVVYPDCLCCPIPRSDADHNRIRPTIFSATVYQILSKSVE